MPGLGRRKRSLACACPNGSRAPAPLSTSRAGRRRGRGVHRPAEPRPPSDPAGGRRRCRSRRTRPADVRRLAADRHRADSATASRPWPPRQDRGSTASRQSRPWAELLSNINPRSLGAIRDPDARYEPGSTATGPVSRTNRAATRIPDACVGSESRSNTTGADIRQIPTRRRPAGRRGRGRSSEVPAQVGFRPAAGSGADIRQVPTDGTTLAGGEKARHSGQPAPAGAARSPCYSGARGSGERSHRGLVQRFAKPPSGVTCFEGSNPSLSAISRVAPVAQRIER